ncbi:MAG: galactose mutarotase [Methylotenera sp.]|uniref:aldose epimerase family protein n=1 Tax=Methylotenera sp. TaxID=2051956 RepID=UPI002489D840|nr:aldose epimerase family protein [Methylotenera sp.]MDI1310346.1 galactose mutarotase [Methylotenera sp.]
MPIRKEPFGATKEGKTVERYQLINRDGLRVCILTYGGIVQTLEVADRYGKVDDVVLGFDTLQPYLNEHPYFGALIGRYANRIANGRFSLAGNEYKLATNNGCNHLHGGMQGFDKKVWHARIEETTNAARLVLSYISRDGEEGYPGTLSVEVAYTWSDSQELHIDYTASTDAPTILNLTNHSYFNLSGMERQSDVLAHRIKLCAARYLPINSNLIPLGEQAKVDGTCMDFRQQASIGEKLDNTNEQIRSANGGYDHAWIIDENKGGLTLAALVEEPISGRRMRVYTTQPAIQFYTGNFLDGSVLGKKNMPYDKYAGFCLETQHYPDAPNHLEFPSTELKPGSVYRQTTSYQFDSEPV